VIRDLAHIAAATVLVGAITCGLLATGALLVRWAVNAFAGAP